MAWLVFYKDPWIADPCALESNFFSYILFIQTLSSNQASIWLSLSGLRPWSYLWLPISAVFYILPSGQHIHLYFFQNPCRIHPSHTPRSPPCDIDTCLSEPLLFSSALCPSQELHSVSALYFLPSVQQWFSKTEPGNTSTPQLLYGQMPFQRPPWSHWNRGLTTRSFSFSILLVPLASGHTNQEYCCWAPTVACTFQQGSSLLRLPYLSLFSNLCLGSVPLGFSRCFLSYIFYFKRILHPWNIGKNTPRSADLPFSKTEGLLITWQYLLFVSFLLAQQ